MQILISQVYNLINIILFHIFLFLDVVSKRKDALLSQSCFSVCYILKTKYMKIVRAFHGLPIVKRI